MCLAIKGRSGWGRGRGRSRGRGSGRGTGMGRGRGRWHHNCTLLLFASHWEFLSFFIKRDMPLAQRKKCKSWFVYLFTNK